MTKFESGVKVVPASQEAVYEKLSDLSNLEKDINPFMKAMVQKPLQEGLEKMADMLAMIQY